MMNSFERFQHGLTSAIKSYVAGTNIALKYIIIKLSTSTNAPMHKEFLIIFVIHRQHDIRRNQAGETIRK